MAQDYHIYIHSDNNGGGNGSKTQPFSSDKNSAFKPKENKSLVEDEQAQETGAAALGKVAPWVAIAIAVIKVADKVMTTGFSHLREYTGHYEYELGYNNFKTTINHVMNPVGYVRQVIRRNLQFNKENERIQEESKVIGKTIYSDTKIGV